MISMGSGGAEKVVSLLLKKLIKDYNVNLILFYDVIHFPIPEEVNILILSKNQTDVPFYTKIFDFFNFLWSYHNFIKNNKIDLSISFLAFPNLINGIISILNKRVKTVISERGFPSDNTTTKISLYISKVFYPILYNRCNLLFSNSVHINDDLSKNFGIKIPMEVIYNPIEIPLIKIIPESLNRKSQNFNLITAGTLNKRKNHIMIIRALKDVDKNVNLCILGGGPLKAFLEDKIISYNLIDQIKLKGRVKNVDEYFRESDCFVLSSFTEGFPNALLEAMSIGLPCISSNCLSGPLELLNDNKKAFINEGDFYFAKYGLLVNNDDDKGLQKAIQYFKDNPDMRVKYSELSLLRSKDYYIDTVYSNFNQFIQK